MGFASLRFYNYRNLIDAEISVEAPEVYLVGENGQGKTNFLESVYLLCFGASFRSSMDREIIRHGEREMAVSGVYVDADEQRDDISLKLQRGKKNITLAGKPVKDRKDLIEHSPCIVFSHDDIGFVSGPPERRRWFFNQTMSLNHPLFIDTLRRYNRVIKARNAALKERRLDLVAVYDEQAATAGLEIQKARWVTEERFNRWFTDLFAQVSELESEVTIRYRPSWKNVATTDDAISFMRSREELDLSLGTTTSGPHRDRFTFMADGRDFSTTASTGQLRLMSLVLRVSQAQFYAAETGRLPVLLLDDVLLELDARRRRKFLSLLPGHEQAFFTFLPDEQYDSYRSSETLIYQVEAGAVSTA